jgi:hypothetical protein
MIAIDDAVGAGGDGGRITRARNALARGAKEDAAGHFASAISQYRSAWDYTQRAIVAN